MNLATRFKETSSAAGLADACEDGPLEAALEDFTKRGATAWPGLALPSEVLAAYLGERAPPDVSPLEWLAGARAADLFLACACAESLPAALRAFEATFVLQVGGYLRPLRATPEVVADATQELLEKLFVGTAGGPPRIRQYTGQGALGAWVKVIAVRTALDLIAARNAGERPSDGVDEIADAVVHTQGPELEVLEARYRDEFRGAVRDAMADVSLRERAMLRFIFVERLTPGRLGVMYGVHRTTVMRWVEAAEANVLARVRARLMGRLSVSPSECDSLIAALKSRIDITLSSLLGA
jgi:RNA polymerase sigma-70 factor (ECF subfamily)